LEKVIDEYLGYFAGGSSHTARAKQIDLRDFVEFLRRHRDLKQNLTLKTSQWDHSSVQSYLEDLLNRGAAPASVARRLATLKHFGRTLADSVVGFVNPAKEAKAPKTSLQRPKGLSPEEAQATVDSLLASVENTKNFNKTRNATLLVFLLETGLRAEECRYLRVLQLAEDLRWIKNVRTKGRKFRNIYISSRLKPILEKYMTRRSLELKRFYPEIKVNQNARLPLFISTYNAEPQTPDSFLMGAKTLWRSIHGISKELHLHPHLLRHSFALNLLESSKDVRLVSQALGHSDVRVTMRYTQRQDEDVAKAMEDMGVPKIQDTQI
jgi:site-specific recombinase XerD